MRKLACVALFVFVLLAAGWIAGETAPSPAGPHALGVAKLQRAYHAWVRDHESYGGDRHVRVALRYSKGLSSEWSEASGTVSLDLARGRVQAQIAGLPEGEFDLWLVDNRPAPGRSVLPEAGDAHFRVGRLEREGPLARLHAALPPALLGELQIDVITVTRSDRGPKRGVLYGSLPLFQRIYTALRTPALFQRSDYRGSAGGPALAIGVAWAQAPIVDPDVVLDRLVASGADLFTKETFQGNGRTCATCHPFSANTQLSASDIAAPPHESQDGFGDLVNRFHMRGIPHALALSTSPSAPVGNADRPLPHGNPPADRTGGSGDGTPHSGSLRDFATGAVVQHFPRTSARIAGVDFRLPTDLELDALEAFQRSLAVRNPVIERRPLPASRGETAASARCPARKEGSATAPSAPRC